MWFLIISCHVWQFWPRNSLGYGPNDFKFTGELPLISIYTVYKNEKDWGILEAAALFQRPFFPKIAFLVIFEIFTS